jgi:alpha-1,3-fucosyltransferase 10
MLDGKPLILIHNQFFDAWPELPSPTRTNCVFTTDPAAADDADAIVVHIPSLQSMGGLMKRPHQLLVAWSMESPVMCRPLANAAFMQQFDLMMTYERSSDVWSPYFGPERMDGFRRSPHPKDAASPVVLLQGNALDACNRLEYLTELSSAVSIDSFGKVLRNRVTTIEPGGAARIALYSHYKMTLAFENSIAPDYVTEKFYEPLEAGSVPVYRGAQEVADLAPAPDCFIDANLFENARHLGEYLDFVAHNDDEYGKYQEWRWRGFSPAFLQHVGVC